jgi:iron complex outermembrane receptor protein
MVEKMLSRSVRLMFVGGLVAGAFATQTTLAEEVIQRVEVTGSSIKRIASESALPVQTFSQKDIQKSGVTTVTDFIQQMPVMQGFAVAADSVGGGGGGVTTASIHDVGASYTLVLLNGRRLAPAGSGTTIDLNSIPLSAIERIEVLTDGASALYGSDAIAGVVNFILKKGEAPFQITAKYTRPQHPGGSSSTVGFSKGFGDIDKDGYSLFLSASHDEQKSLKGADREFAKTGIINFKDPSTGDDLLFFNGSSRSIPPNVTVGYNKFDAAGVAIINPATGKPTRTSTSSNYYLQTNGKCPAAHQKLGTQCFFDYTSTVEIAPEQKRNSVFGSGSVMIGNTGFKAFADFAYTDASILAKIAPYPAEFSLAKSSASFVKYVQPYLSANQLANMTDATVKYRLYELGGRHYDYNTKSTHLVAGIDGNAMGWDINSAITSSQNKQTQKYVGGFPLAAKFNAAVDAGTFDPFPYALGEMPAAQVAALKGTQYVGTYNTQDVKMMGVDARASREVFKMSGGAAMLGVGADYRRTKFSLVAAEGVKNAEILFDDPQPEYGLKRSNAGAYAELLMPIMKDLEVTGSLRYDTVSAIDDSKIGQTVGTAEHANTYKISTRYQPTKSLLFRGAIGTGFKSPSMLEIAQPLNDFGVTGGTYECPLSAANGLASHPLAQYCDGKNQYEVFKGGNKNLTPEKSKQWSLGMVFEPTDYFTVGLDYWNVAISNAVSEVSEELIMSNPAKYIDLFTTKYKASTGRETLAIKLMSINIGKAENSGVDYDFAFKTKLAGARWTNRLSGTYLLQSRYTTPGTSDSWETSLGQYGANSAVSFRNVMKFTSSYDTVNWTHTLSANYRGGYKDKRHTEANCAVESVATGDCVDTQLNVGSYSTFDWQTQFRVTKNIEITGGITNVLDTDPPLSLRNTGSHQLGYDPRYASPVGRAFYLAGSYKF